ncbi:lipopolysaccharide assembly LapA domain-containing protein [Metabacillus herbersteinensis]|uniref:Lipopolysaccharide assembly LapA domain-containing protein n=1 Tax=Metabacillus herbersteinensis TaxID=283816 RepID=A0ABV6G8X5_9BACI
MQRQWSIILAILFALIIAVFAVINVDPVEVDYLFGTSQWPLVLVILGSVLMGGFIIASTGVVRIIALQRKLKAAEKENAHLKMEIEASNKKSHIIEPTQIKDKEKREMIDEESNLQ